MDVDGTLTDGKIYISDTGEILKVFSVKDGYGINIILKEHGIVPIVITGRSSRITANRCEEIGIDMYFQNIDDKFTKMLEILKEKNINFNEVAYIGDDLNDYECMKYISENGGIVGCPNDAVDEIKEISEYISKNNGGSGAVRDFIEWLVKM